jgi:Protein of unknown function (DUF973)
MWFGIIVLAGMVSSWVIGFYVVGTMFTSTIFTNLNSTATPSQVSDALGPLFQAITYLVPVTMAIQLAGLLLLTTGFRQLRRVDQQRFSLPSNLMLVLIIGVLIAGAGVIPLFNDIPAIIAQVPSAPGSTPSAALISAIGNIIIFAIVAVVGGLLALIGLIGGLILGIWRVGSRYDEALFKIGAIFVIIPFLDVVAPVLILVAAYQAKGRLPAQG